jgi:hypothetical protein
MTPDFPYLAARIYLTTDGEESLLQGTYRVKPFRLSQKTSIIDTAVKTAQKTALSDATYYLSLSLTPP